VKDENYDLVNIGSLNSQGRSWLSIQHFAKFNTFVEIDEHKHRGASYSCDEKRMYDITPKLGQPCIFIRYNPDSKESDKNILLDKIIYYLNFIDNYESDNESD
jgi:hypothetical protein